MNLNKYRFPCDLSNVSVGFVALDAFSYPFNFGIWMLNLLKDIVDVSMSLICKCI